MSMNFPNLYNLIPVSDFDTPELLQPLTLYGVLLALIIFALMLFFCLHHKVKWDAEKIVLLTFWSICTAAFFLPRMHERYLYAAEILGLVILIYNYRYAYLVAFFLVCATVNYSRYLTENATFPEFSLALETIIYLFVLIYFTLNLLPVLTRSSSPLRKLRSSLSRTR